MASIDIQPAGIAGPIVHYFVEDEPRIVYVNVTVFLAVMAETLRSGAAWWENDAMLEDLRKVYLIHQKYNFGYKFPCSVTQGT